MIISNHNIRGRVTYKKDWERWHNAGIVIMTAIFLLPIILQKGVKMRGKTEETMKLSPWKK